jgi:hypothetical protein
LSGRREQATAPRRTIAAGGRQASTRDRGKVSNLRQSFQTQLVDTAAQFHVLNQEAGRAARLLLNREKQPRLRHRR